MSKKKLKLFIFLYLAWSLIGFYADSEWFSMIPSYLVPLTAICSLYPPLLAIWYSLRYFNRPIPQWFTFWIILGTASYGLMAQLYFPLLMSWKGINFHDAGSMFWVAVYGCQAIYLFPYLGKMRWYSVLPGALFILAADLTHYLVPTFVDFNIAGYPLWMKQLTVSAAVLIQIMSLIVIYTYSHYRQRAQVLSEQALATEAVHN